MIYRTHHLHPHTVSSSYIYDYAIIIQLADGTRRRLDMTIVPLVYRSVKQNQLQHIAPLSLSLLSLSLPFDISIYIPPPLHTYIPTSIYTPTPSTPPPHFPRHADPVNAYLCRPDFFDDPSALTPLVANYIPRAAPCASHTSRSAPYAIASTDYATLHPEEAAWLSQRLTKTAAGVQQFVAGKLTGRSLNTTEARLRVAVANTGGGQARHAP